MFSNRLVLLQVLVNSTKKNLNLNIERGAVRLKFIIAATIAIILIAAGALYEQYGVKNIPLSKPTDQQLITEVLKQNENSSIEYFLEQANPANGLIRDHSTNDSPSSIAAVGFGLTSLVIGNYNGLIPYNFTYDRILTTLDYFYNLTNFNGFYFHFINMNNGTRAYDSEVSPIDTTLFIAGALLAGEYFHGTAIQSMAEKLYERINWQWMTNNTSLLDLAWYPETGFSPYYWTGYSEAALMYMLAIGSPTYPIPVSDWYSWISTWQTNGNGNLKHYASYDESEFTYLYSEAYLNLKNITFPVIGNLWNNSKKAIEYDISFCQNNSQYTTFKEGFWGLSASTGPSGYKAYGAKQGFTDGTVAPYAMISALPLLPNQSKDAVMKLWDMKNFTYGQYGFIDAFNLGDNWYASEFLGIDVGIEVLMEQNYFDGFVWNEFMKLPYIQNAIGSIVNSQI